MRLSLLAHAIRRGVWLLGFAFMICAFLLQAFALHIGRLSVVQPILTMELLFLVSILGTYFRFSISIREWVGAGAIALGLSGFLFFAAPGGGEQVPTNLGWIVVGRRRLRADRPHAWWPPATARAGGRPPCSAPQRPSRMRSRPP